jgi:epoxyqueuosine reductase
MKQILIDSDFVKKLAEEAGFSACGVCRAEEMKEDRSFFESWIDKKLNAGMHYLTRKTELRFNPSLLFHEARTCVVVALSYLHADENEEDYQFRISRYARGADYHHVMNEKLGVLAEKIHRNTDALYRYYCDNSPLAEKSLAVKAGLGWIGKNHLLIHPVYGSWVFLGVIVSQAVIDCDTPFAGSCGKCRICLDACPAGALREDGFLDAPRCISWRTVENKLETARSSDLSGWIFGCDICQEVCPCNAAVPESKEAEFCTGKWQRKLMVSGCSNIDSDMIPESSALHRAGHEKLRRLLSCD